MHPDLKSDLTGKVIVVTGANSGIGFEACRNFARRGATLALVCRNEGRGSEAVKKIEEETGNRQIRLFIADFSSMDSVNDVASALISAYPAIDVLCNNAGAANNEFVLTDDGFETTFAANHLSGFLLTQKLLPVMLSDSHRPARIVFTSSLGHKNSPLDFDDLNLASGYGTLKAYGRSKLMNLLTARVLDQRYREKGLICSSFHPGAVRTAIWGKGGSLAKILGIVMYPFMWNVQKGADTLIWLASSDENEVLNADGKYFFDRQNPKIADFATDDAAERLWSKSEELLSAWLN